MQALDLNKFVSFEVQFNCRLQLDIAEFLQLVALEMDDLQTLELSDRMMNIFEEVVAQLCLLKTQQKLKRTHFGKFVIGDEQMLEVGTGSAEQRKNSKIVMTQIKKSQYVEAIYLLSHLDFVVG